MSSQLSVNRNKVRLTAMNQVFLTMYGAILRTKQMFSLEIKIALYGAKSIVFES